MQTDKNGLQRVRPYSQLKDGSSNHLNTNQHELEIVE